MIDLPPQLIPSHLLHMDDLLPAIADLLHGSRELREVGRLAEAERCALDAIEVSQEPGTSRSQAIALVHLADIYRETGRLGPALTSYRKAHRIFRRQTSRYERHNEAITTYALGLLNHLLSNDTQALKLYQTAVDLLERVQDDWVEVNALDDVEACKRVQRWMKTLSKHLTAARTSADGDLTARMWVPIILPETNGHGFALAELAIDQYRIDRQMTIDGEIFDVMPLKGNRRISLEPDGEYYAMEIPKEACDPLGAKTGDYALIGREREADKEGHGVLETLSGAEFGRFERDEDGNIRFVRSNAEIIGSADIGDQLQVGYVTALLRHT